MAASSHWGKAIFETRRDLRRHFGDPNAIGYGSSRYATSFPTRLVLVEIGQVSIETSPMPRRMSPAIWLKRVCELELERTGGDVPMWIGAPLYAALHDSIYLSPDPPRA